MNVLAGIFDGHNILNVYLITSYSRKKVISYIKSADELFKTHKSCVKKHKKIGIFGKRVKNGSFGSRKVPNVGI